jgi:hypothetical protein
VEIIIGLMAIAGLVAIVVGAALAVSDTIGYGTLLGACISMLVTLGGVLLRNLTKSAQGGWDAYDKLRREKNGQIIRLQYEVGLWQARALGSPEPVWKEPTEEELDK